MSGLVQKQWSREAGDMDSLDCRLDRDFSGNGSQIHPLLEEYYVVEIFVGLSTSCQSKTEMSG